MRSYVVLAVALFVAACASNFPIEPITTLQPAAHIMDAGGLQTQPLDTSEDTAKKESHSDAMPEPSKLLRVYWFFGDHGG